MTTAEHRSGATLLRMSWQLPLALGLGALALLVVGFRPEVAGFLYLAAVTGELARVDIEQHRLPNGLVLPGYGIAVLGIVAGWFTSGEVHILPFLSCIAMLLFLLLMNLAGGMGMGDVKLGGLLGLCLGAIGLLPAILGPALGFIAGGIAGASALFSSHKGVLRRIPFGPFLLLGFWLATASALVLARWT